MQEPERPSRPSLVGVERADAERTVDEFFAALPWEPVPLDPDMLTAERFLQAL